MKCLSLWKMLNIIEKIKYNNICLYSNFPNNFSETKNFLLESKGKGSIDLILENDGVAQLTINNPAQKNALSGKMMVELYEAIEKLEAWTIGKAVLVKGESHGGFCSGGDLDFVRKVASPEVGKDFSFYMTHLLTRLAKLPLITVAFIEPPGAFGGGAEISVACDFRIIDPKAKIGFVHSRMGILPAWGGTSRLVNLIGASKALRLVSSGVVLESTEAMNVGLVDDLASSHEDALEFLKKISAPPAPIVRSAKLSVLSPNDHSLHTQLFASLFGGELNKQALNQNIKHR